VTATSLLEKSVSIVLGNLMSEPIPIVSLENLTLLGLDMACDYLHPLVAQAISSNYIPSGRRSI